MSEEGLHAAIRLHRIEIARLQLELARSQRELASVRLSRAEEELERRHWESENGTMYVPPWRQP